MILFDGIALENIAPGIKIEDIRVSPIQYEPLTRPRPIRAGSDFVRNRPGTRTVTITFALFEMNKVKRHALLMNISAWAKTDKERKIELPIDPNRYLTGVCTAKPEPSTRQWFESKLRLVFTCFNNPFWTNKGERAVACGTQFVALGDAVPFMRIERTLSAQATNQTYSNGAQSMTFSTVPAGNLVIDLNEQTAKVGNTDIMQYYQPSGRFILPKIGIQTITGTGTVKIRERFE